jgi:hypothetical protein
MKRQETKLLIEGIDKSFLTIKSMKDDIIKQFREGKKLGTKTYVSDIDSVSINSSFSSRAWSWMEGEVNLWTGYNNEGKSQLLIFLSLLKALNEGKKFAFFSPENFPPIDFFDDIVHTLLGKTTDRTNSLFDMREDEYVNALERVMDLFFLVHPVKDGKPDFRIEVIDDVFKYLIWEYDVFGVVVDPYIKIRHEMMIGEQEHQYASRFMMDRVLFARENNVSYNIVMHQLTAQKKEDGNYYKPSLYSIKGGGTFSDSADNVITVWRPFRGSDPLSTKVSFISEKIKKQKQVGVPFRVDMDFNRKKNRYMSLNGRDYMDGSVPIEIGEPKSELMIEYNPDRFISDGRNDFDPAPF